MPLDDSEMLEDLRRLWMRKGKLNSEMINAAKDVPSIVAYKNHFGGLNETYKLIAYPITRKPALFIEALRVVHELVSLSLAAS